MHFFDYDLPEHLIAQHPAAERDEARLLVVRRDTQSIHHHVFRDLPDPAIGFDGVELDPAAPLAGDPTQVTLTVRNAGTAEATDFAVEVFDGPPEAGGASLFATRIAALAPAANRALAFSWPAAGGRRTLVAVLDGGGEILELAEDNNRAEREVTVPRAAGPAPRTAVAPRAGAIRRRPAGSGFPAHPRCTPRRPRCGSRRRAGTRPPAPSRRWRRGRSSSPRPAACR